LRFNADGSFSDVLLEDAGGFGQLNRPEGVVFGPDGNLYVTSFRAAPGDKDGVRVYDPSTGDFIRQIDYYDDPVNDLRVSAQAILFGPDGKLYAPMLQTGEVRAYDVSTDDYTTFVAAGTHLINPFFMTFGSTNPSTLAYEGAGAGLSVEAIAIPEPATVVIAVVALVGLIGGARSRGRYRR
jgi:WD40 repeat protein